MVFCVLGCSNRVQPKSQTVSLEMGTRAMLGCYSTMVSITWLGVQVLFFAVETLSEVISTSLEAVDSPPPTPTHHLWSRRNYVNTCTHTYSTGGTAVVHTLCCLLFRYNVLIHAVAMMNV